MALEHWILELEISELEGSIRYGKHALVVRKKLILKLEELYAESRALAHPDL